MKKTSYSLTLTALLFAGTLCRGQVITTFAGNGAPTYPTDGGPATAAMLAHPNSTAVDNSGNVYICDFGGSRIRKVNRAGIISTYAGGTFGYWGDGGPATAAAMFEINSIAIDASQNLYISDAGNNVVRKVNAAGIMSTFAGTSATGYSGDGGAADTARFLGVSGVAVDDAGNVFIVDRYNNVIRKVDAAGIITTFAGSGVSGFGGDGGPATAALLHTPTAVATDHSGNVYIADGSHRVRKVDAAGIISTIAGIGSLGYTGDGGPATLAAVSNICGLAADGLGNLVMSDADNNVVRRIDAAGTITTIAGLPLINGYTGDGGLADSATFKTPLGLAFDAIGNIYIADVGNDAIRRISAISGTTHICIGDSVAFNVSVVGGVWSSSVPAIASVGAASGVVHGVAAGSADISYSTGTDTVAVTVFIDAAPSAGVITGPDSVCVYSTVTMADAMPGGMWHLSNGYAHNMGNSVSGDSKGIDTVLYNVYYTCGMATAKFPITVVHPDAGTITGAHNVCPGDTIVFSDTATGGEWFLYDTTIATMIAPGIVKAISPGGNGLEYVITTTIPLCSAFAFFSFTIDSPSHCIPSAVPNETLGRNEVHVYPNPSTGTLYVETGNINEQRTITISDMYGRIMLNTTMMANATKTELNLRVPPGTYILNIQGPGGMEIRKVVIE